MCWQPLNSLNCPNEQLLHCEDDCLSFEYNLITIPVARPGQPSPSPPPPPAPRPPAPRSPSPGTERSPGAPPRRSSRPPGRRPGRSWRRRLCLAGRESVEWSRFDDFSVGGEEGGEMMGEHSLRQGQSYPPSSGTIPGLLSRGLCIRRVVGEVGDTRGERRGRGGKGNPRRRC